jgi:hypothetical protein
MGDGITHDRVHGGVAGRWPALYAGPTRMDALCPIGFRAGLWSCYDCVKKGGVPLRPSTAASKYNGGLTRS